MSTQRYILIDNHDLSPAELGEILTDLDAAIEKPQPNTPVRPEELFVSVLSFDSTQTIAEGRFNNGKYNAWLNQHGPNNKVTLVNFTKDLTEEVTDEDSKKATKINYHSQKAAAAAAAREHMAANLGRWDAQIEIT